MSTEPDQEVKMWCARTLDPETVRRWRREEKVVEIMGRLIRVAWWATLIGAGYAICNIVKGLQLT